MACELTIFAFPQLRNFYSHHILPPLLYNQFITRLSTIYVVQPKTKNPTLFSIYILQSNSGPCSSVGIANGYGLDDPEIESRWGRDFLHLSIPALGPTQPPVQWVPGVSRG